MIVFAMTGAEGTAGGIATSNQNVLYALDSLSAQFGRPLVVLSLHERDEDRPNFLSNQTTFIGFGGRKLSYAASLIRYFRHDRFFLFDHVRLGLPLAPLVVFGFRDFVIMAHGSESWRRARRMSKWLFRRARLCCTNSQFTLARMQETFSGFQGRVCALGLSPSHVARDRIDDLQRSAMSIYAVDGEKRDLGRRVILLVGRMDRGEREKGHYEMLSVWPSVLAEFPDAQLVFAGPGNDRSTLMEMAADLRVASSVFIPGHLSTADLKTLYRKCYAFVMPSRQEGFGLVYLEAMSSAKPCVGCRNGGGEEIIDDGVSGLLIENPYENDELVLVIKRLLGNEELARRLGHGGLRRLEERFTAVHAQGRLKALLSPLLQ